MVSSPNFSDDITNWIKLVNDAISSELADDIDAYQEIFSEIHMIHNIFSEVSAQLPLGSAMWIYGKDEVSSYSSNIQIIMQFLIQAIYMEASHLWPAANHSARCAVEHTFWLIWQILNPSGSRTQIGGPEQAKFAEMKEAVLNIPRYKLDIEFEINGNSLDIDSFVTTTYKHLSYYVHTSNIHIGLRGRRPHITHDLATNPKAERDTRENIRNAFLLVVFLLSIACKENLQQSHVKDVTNLNSINTDSFSSEIKMN